MEIKIKRDVLKCGSIYYPIDCPWPSEESDKITEAAHKEYEELIKTKKPVYLVMSNHWATQGYWIEFEKSSVSDIDILIQTNE